jgi:charged multivesicular body protein 4A/B
MLTNLLYREDLREQHAIGEEISEAITQSIGTQNVDEDELDEELADLQQEELDNRMLNTGNVPVGDKVHQLPTAAQGESKWCPQDDSSLPIEC